MKVRIDNYRNHWLSPYTILQQVIFWRKIDYDEPLIVRWHNMLNPLCEASKWVLDKVHPRQVKVKIDRWDTWSMDHTLALIALPMLKQLKETKHGAPFVDDSDVPEELKSTCAPPVDPDSGDVDSNHFKRWDYVIDEMIFAFEAMVDDSWENQFHTGEIDVSFEKVEGSTYSVLTRGPNHTHEIDMEGLNAYNKRIDNGLRLFGVYYRGLWD